MHVTLLTTETSHHLYFAHALHAIHPLAAILVETDTWRPPFETAHAFEARRDDFERTTLLAGHPTTFASLAETRAFPSANDSAATAWLGSQAPDVVLVFGAGRLMPTTLDTASVFLNLHGGNPEEYRGLDTHLWAIYHRDFANLMTTLHRVDPGLDTGEIVLQAPLPLAPVMPLHELRSVNTRVCVALADQALRGLRNDRLPGRPQMRRGRYYSFMPAVLKEDCVRKFARHVASL